MANMDFQRYRQLLEHYLDDSLSNEELAEFVISIKDQEFAGLLLDIIAASLADQRYGGLANKLEGDRIFLKVMQMANNRQEVGVTGVRVRKIFIWRKIAVAASILLAISTSVYFLFLHKTDLPNSYVETVLPTGDVPAPNNNRAMITLANGQQVLLDSMENGVMALQENVKLIKLADGRIAYNQEAATVNEVIPFNTLYNPRGSKVIDMKLADGSRVWLNAGSSVTYPVVFTGKERNVSISGEAYFEVTHDAAKPFIVSKGAMHVTVLGTRFNINAYDDEAAIRVTLLEGSVKVNATTDLQSLLLKPGQQAIVSRSNTLSMASTVDIDAAMAWKNGLFNFNNADLSMVLRQLARWYDLQVIYQGVVPQRKFGGEMQRSLNLSEVLKLLERNNVRFILDGKKLTITP
jgi:transmembrane sensor